MKGVTIFLGATGSTLCPVNALLAYVDVRGQAPGPLFRFKDQQPLTRERLVSCLRTAISKAGFDPNLYAGHSFRIGAATAAHLNGVEDSTIMTLGKWKSDAYLRYIRTPKEQLAKLSTRIANPIDPNNITIHISTCRLTQLYVLSVWGN